jgi:hypothetical protein
MKVKWCCRRGRPLGELVWARVTDESKCSRQGLVVWRDLTLESPCDACPGVTLAPALAATVAAQSRTVFL